MILRLSFTLAILIGLAVAPSAQVFRWQAGWTGSGRAGAEDWLIRIEEGVVEHIERAIERVSRAAEPAAGRMSARVEHLADRLHRAIEGRADRVPARIESRVHEDVRHVVDRHVRAAWDWEAIQIGQSDDPCRDSGRDDDSYRHCEVREERLLAGPLTVDAGPNGGIRVEAWDENQILVRAVVTANAREEADAKRIASEVQIQAGGGRVRATGPQTGRREWWSVSYRINVPSRTDLDLSTRNGGITIAGVAGTIRFDTNNGGVRLTDLAGSVRGGTRNGGLNVALAGSRWDGEGLDVETSNGGVTLAIPDGYNAELETRTVNGGFRFDYPLTITGELSPRRGINTTLGSGGPPVRVRTQNGALRIQRR